MLFCVASFIFILLRLFCQIFLSMNKSKVKEGTKDCSKTEYKYWLLTVMMSFWDLVWRKLRAWPRGWSSAWALGRSRWADAASLHTRPLLL